MKNFSAIGLVFLVGCALDSTTEMHVDDSQQHVVFEQHAWGPKNPNKQRYHWPSSNLNPSVLNNSTTFYGVTKTIADWNALNTPIQPVEVSSTTFDIEVYEDGTNQDNWIGLAKIWLSSDGTHIVRGEVIMNTTMIEARYKHLPNLPQHVLCQEIGHVLGLNHSHDSLDTCMNDCATTREFSAWESCINHPDGTTPNGHDAETLLVSYGHNDSDSSGSNSGPCQKNPNNPRCQGAPNLTHAFPAP